jgi:hypothetical protein
MRDGSRARIANVQFSVVLHLGNIAKGRIHVFRAVAGPVTIVTRLGRRPLATAGENILELWTFNNE